jgi:periplasmic protein CpxP/Spy
MNSYLRSFLLASALALGVSATSTFAQTATPVAQKDMRGGGHGMHDGGPRQWLRRLDLSEAQRDQVFKILHDQAPAIREQAKAARRAGQELRQAALSGGFDRARARQLADVQAKALSEMALLRADTMSRVVALLTPEQRQKLQQHNERRGQRSQRG